MNESESEKGDKSSPAIQREDVEIWLRSNPDFFRKNPEILDEMKPPVERTGKGIADFQSYMIERLKSDKQQVLETTQEIVETSRANMTNQSRIQKTVIRLLEAQNLDEFLHALTIDTANILSVDICALIVESNGKDIPHVHFSGVRVVPPDTIHKWMEEKKCLLQDHISGIEAIYGGAAGLVQSQLIIRLDISSDTPPALIAFGSRDPELFQDGMGTEHVRFLASVIERCLARFLQV